MTHIDSLVRGVCSAASRILGVPIAPALGKTMKKVTIYDKRSSIKDREPRQSSFPVALETTAAQRSGWSSAHLRRMSEG